MSELPPQDDQNPSAAPEQRQPGIVPVDETQAGDRTRPGVESGAPPNASAGRTRAQAERARSGSRPRSEGTRRQYSSQRAAAAPPPIQPPQPVVGTARQRVQQRRRHTPPSESGLYFPWWSLVIMVGTVGVVAFGLLFAFTELSEPATPQDQLPRIQVVTSQPTLSQDFGTGANPAAAPQEGAWPTAIPQAQPSATVALPTPIPTQTLPPGNFAIGSRVQVVGVGDTKLNVRSAPGLDGSLVFLALDGDLYQLVGGPQDVDGYEWWKLEDPNDPARVGWAARNFLMVASQ